MRNLGTLVALVLAACGPNHRAVTPVAPTPVEVPDLPARSAEIVISVDGSKLSINGRAVSLTPTVADFEAIFGKADRVTDKLNRIHTWDRLGLLVYEPYDGRATSLSLYFAPPQLEFGARSGFDGTLVVDGHTIDLDTAFSDVAWLGKRGMFGASITSERASGFHVFASAPSADDLLEVASLSFYNKRELERPSAQGMRTAVTACRDGVAESCTALALIYYSFRDTDSIKTGYQYAKRACSLGDRTGCTLARVE